ncbi:MAG: hypothetical protein H6713_32420 [Myxococcales bacterium]|nr:hypothetical protein [Myxococcales bacterium]
MHVGPRRHVSVRASVRVSVRASIHASVRASIHASVRASIHAPLHAPLASLDARARERAALLVLELLRHHFLRARANMSLRREDLVLFLLPQRQRAQLEHLALELTHAPLCDRRGADAKRRANRIDNRQAERDHPPREQSRDVRLVAAADERHVEVKRRRPEKHLDPDRVLLERQRRP